MASTLLLDRNAWDLAVDAIGNIALASEPYSILQDVASACRLFQGELWYGGTDGLPYFDQILGEYQPIQVLKDGLVRAALSVPGVLAATVFLTAVVGRQISGQVQITTSAGPAIVTL
jgi:hypothetical protein